MHKQTRTWDHGPRTTDHGRFWAPGTRHRALVLAFIVCHLSFSISFGQATQQSEIPSPLGARSLSLRFDHLSIEDGLSQSMVIDILQDRAGYVWFAAQDGLNRYDGYEIKNYYRQPFDSTSLPDTWNTALMEDRDGYLWVGGQGVISRMDPATGSFSRYYFPVQDSTQYVQAIVTSMAQDATGAIWAGTVGLGLQRLNPSDGPDFVTYRHDPDDSESIPSGAVFDLLVDSDGSLWANASDGLSRMEMDSPGRFERYYGNESLPPDRVMFRGLLEREEEPGVLWVGHGQGLVRLDVATRETKTFPIGDLSPGGIGDILQDPTDPGIIWVTLEEGIARFDIRSGAFFPYIHDDANDQSISPGTPMRLGRDRSGTVWVGTRGYGVDRFRSSSIGFETVGAKPGSKSLFAGHEVRPIFLGRDDVLWVVSSFEGKWQLTALDRTTGRSQTFMHVPGDSRSLPEGRIGGIFEDSRGDVWVGGAGVLSRLDRDRGSFRHFRHDRSDPTSITDGLLFFMLEDRSGFLWIATTTGLERMDLRNPGVFKHFVHDPNDPATLSSNNLIKVAQDASGYIWTSSLNGVNRMDPTTGKVTRYQHDPDDRSSLASDRVWDVMVPKLDPGVVWVSGFGLSRLDVESGTSHLYTTKDGLPNNTVYGALEDDRGMIWASTNNGLSRFDPANETFRNYGLEAGLQSLEFNGESFHKGYNGELFFGGINGLNAFFPNSLSESTTEPETRIVDIRVGGRPLDQASNAALETSVPFLQELTLGPEQKDLSFVFNAFHYKHPEKNEYEYLLEGFNDDWVKSGTRRTASFANLDPGDYSLFVKAANSDGVWDEKGASLRIHVLPPWWQTWWAYGLYLIAFVAGAFGVDRFQRHRLLEKERQRSREKELVQAREIKKAYEELEETHKNLKRTQDQLIQAEKMASLGQLTAGIAHEIKNPLNFVNNFSDMSRELAIELEQEIESRRDTLPGDFVEEVEDILQSLKLNAQKIYEHGRRADGIVYSMLQHSRGGEGEQQEVALNAFVEEYFNLAYHGMRARNSDFNATLVRSYDEAVGNVVIVAQDMGRVFLNLLGNAFDALEEHGAPDGNPTVSVATERKDGIVEVRIGDNGPGIPDHVKARIFEPFFTTKPTGKGTGLGLSMSYDIVTKGHGGTLDVESEDGEGATFVVRLPV